MTQFGLTDDQLALLDMADRFGRNELLPLAEKMDNDEWWPPDLMATLGANGLLGATIPEEFGGAGMGMLDSGLVLQAFSRWNHVRVIVGRPRQPLCEQHLRQRQRRHPPTFPSEAVLG